MTAIDKFKEEIKEYPPRVGRELPPMLRAGMGAFPAGVAEVLLELIERVEAIERSEAS